MRIGLISDIHANLPALQKALSLFDRERVDTVLCAGDLVDGNRYGDAVVALIQQRQIPCVQGNHDQNAASEQQWLQEAYDPDDPKIKSALLSKNTVSFVDSLPLTLTFRFDEIHVFLAHGTPWSNTTYLYPDSPYELFEQVATRTQANIVILGHTHVPMCKHVKQCWIINPGSVDGNRYESRQTCAVLELAPFSVSIFDINSSKIVRTCGG